MDVFDAITSRVSVTQYQDRSIDREQIARVLEAGRWAPSAGNMQTWEFIVVEDPELKEKLSQYAHNQPHIREAPVAVVILSDMERADRRYGERGMNLYAVQESGAVLQNMMLEAYNQELGAAWVGAFDEESVADILHIPERLRPMAIVTLGHPADWPEQPTKFSLSNITYMNRYGERITPLYDKIVWRGVSTYKDKASRKLQDLKDKYT